MGVMTVKIHISIGGIPIEELSEEEIKQWQQKMTDKVADVFTDHVQKMINRGASQKEIIDFLGLNTQHAKAN